MEVFFFLLLVLSLSPPVLVVCRLVRSLDGSAVTLLCLLGDAFGGC